MAYVSAAPDSRLDIDSLRTHCKPILGFRTPKQFRLVETLPKNANGKVDKPALKADLLREREAKSHA